MLGMNIISRFCVQCSAVSMRNRTNHSIVSPLTAVNYTKRYQTSSNRDATKSIDASLNEEFDFETESPYATVDFEAVSAGDADKLKHLKVLQLELDLMRQQGEQVPTRLNTQNWKDLLTFDSHLAREKFLRHLWIVEMKDKHRKEKSQIKAQLLAEFKANEESHPEPVTTGSPISYKLNRTTLFYRMRDSTMHQFYNYKLLMAEWFGPKILVDCGYDQFMDLKNTQSCVKQMLFMWSDNRLNINPYDLIYCNVDPQSSLWQKFIQRIPMITEADSPVHFTNRHYLEMFPREKLVYLTPHCKQVLEEYSHDDIYIIAAYVDVNHCQPLSLAKAKKEKLRMAKLPFDKYLQWAVGHKNLPINQILAILNDLKDGSSWQAALKHVPGRKIASHNLDVEQDEQKLNYRTAKGIREDYRRNLVYDLLINQSPAKGSGKK